ncbi:hypothetical protein PHET_11579 [Paragonimus heterotremus]|uniref:Uncharacterized protein n=1 Tax=Paragonimus heterotremus TaxID=100268 RepID=A0A8J4T3W4_9TREM|nr:hypothetical protein PHET_11579 [Paragonimus heterotremus]
MFQNTYELRDLWDNKSTQLRIKGQPEYVDVYSAPNAIDSAFLGPTLWDDLLTISDLEDINLEEFSPSVLESHLSTSDSECAFADNLKYGYTVLSDVSDLKQPAGASVNKASWPDAEHKTPGATKCSEIPSAAASIKSKVSFQSSCLRTCGILIILCVRYWIFFFLLSLSCLFICVKDGLLARSLFICCLFRSASSKRFSD